MSEKGRELLDVLMQWYSGWATQCFYCGRDVVNPRLMPTGYQPQRCGPDKVRFTIKGRQHIAFIATADHYFDRCYGGRSTLNNILPACRPCNNARSHGREWPLCIDCDTKRRIYGKRCAECRRNNDLKAVEADAYYRLISGIIRTVLNTSTGKQGGGLPTR